MRTSYTHFTTEEREKLLIFRTEKLGIREMARRLNRSPSSVSRELKRNQNQDGHYSPSAANEAYRLRRRKSVRHRKLDNPVRRSYVTEKLTALWSPEQIAGRLKLENNPLQVSYATIYRAIHNGLLDIPLDCLRHKGSRRSGKKGSKCPQGRKSIHERPRSADNRSRFGHWEGDTIHGAGHKGAIATFVDRRSGFLTAVLMPDLKSETMNRAMWDAFRAIPAELIRSITVDNGSEFAGFTEMEDMLETNIFFADPYRPSQRGTSENTNGLLRQYFPKQSNLLDTSPQECLAAVNALNDRPRKRLGFRTPREVFPCSRLLHFT